ncbi:hypothetical protein Agabi119p4_9883 [Agaricus bisporus var. burnettii]|uniref:Uncharacterized protein n=1 Tax=Agaricus bisporus var. burnettii TaxID=192524 RepID=A0A8H7EX86_AGABI|nr:hypothetical protein Agabi119p4_9883 [Agaricus bisporus var. burnettii]
MADNTVDTDYDYINFDANGEWDEANLIGPAVLVPKHIRSLVVTEYRLEWLNLSDPGEHLKNHMIAAVTFSTPIYLNNDWYYAARLSMETATNDQAYKDVQGAETYEPCDDFWIGNYELRLRSYTGPTKSKAHLVTFELKQGTTVGDLIDKVVEKKMHHFCFLPYIKRGETQPHWRGCRDHILHCWAMFVREGIITSEKSEERPSTPLWMELNVNYNPEEAHGAFTSSPMLIDRGWWVFQKPTQDDLHTPDDAFSKEKPAIPHRPL